MKYYHKINFILVLIIWVTTIISTFYLPNIIPSHYTGEHIDTYGSKYVNFVLPILLLIFWCFVPFGEKIYKKNETNSILKFQITILLGFVAAVVLNSYLLMKALKYTKIIFSSEMILNAIVFFVYVLVALFIAFMDNENLIKINWKEFRIKNNDIKRIVIVMVLCFIGFTPIWFHFTLIFSMLLLFIIIIKCILTIYALQSNNK